MKRGSTVAMRCAVMAAGIAVLVLCISLAWVTFTEGTAAEEYSVDHTMLIVCIGTCAAAVPFLIAVRQTLKLLDSIDAGHAFTDLSVRALNRIMHCAVAVFLICLLGGTPFLLALGRSDGNPGMAFLGLVPAGVSFIIAVFASVLKRLLEDAVAAKAENDLTI